MAIRVRKIGEHVVALCAAKTSEEKGDLYLDDNVHHALMVKFSLDLKSEGFAPDPPIDCVIADIMELAERT